MSILILFPGAVFAQTESRTDLTPQQKEQFYRSSGIYFYDPAGASYGCSDGLEPSTTLVGNSNIEKAFGYLIQKGLNDYQAAGVVGNLYAESGVDPTRKENRTGRAYLTFSHPDEITSGTGFGIAQWTSAGRQDAWKNYALEQSSDPYYILTMDLQLDFLWHELQTNSNYGLSELRDSDDIAMATWIFLVFYEKPGVVLDYARTLEIPPSGPARQEFDKRASNAARILQEYGGENISSFTMETCGNDYGGDINTPEFAASGVRVDGSPAWDMGANCTGTFTEGARVLRDYLLERWQPPVTSIGGYDCRPIVGNGLKTSIHGMGRALDIMISAENPDTREVGDQIRNWLINNSVELGLQRVIWNRYTWSSQRDGWRDYCQNQCTDQGGSRNPHTDHLHIELNNDGANMLTSFFVGNN